jgi:hypothetical protein
MWIDKGLEVNPNNDSMHPISSQGTNQTAAMAVSLAGGTNVGSGAGQWDITSTSTISCTACHGSSAGAGDSHASTHRGILRWNYQDRVLNTAGVAYAGTDFTLCWQCHSQGPFTLTKSGTTWSASDETSGATNFSYLHTFHASQIADVNDNASAGTDIDVSGDGNGNAVCAECHFRLHSTADVVSGQNLNSGNKSRLVNFAPNVMSVDGGGTPVTWVMKNGATPGSCTLTCHGYTHTDSQY